MLFQHLETLSEWSDDGKVFETVSLNNVEYTYSTSHYISNIFQWLLKKPKLSPLVAFNYLKKNSKLEWKKTEGYIYIYP